MPYFFVDIPGQGRQSIFAANRSVAERIASAEGGRVVGLDGSRAVDDNSSDSDRSPVPATTTPTSPPATAEPAPTTPAPTPAPATGGDRAFFFDIPGNQMLVTARDKTEAINLAQVRLRQLGIDPNITEIKQILDAANQNGVTGAELSTALAATPQLVNRSVLTSGQPAVVPPASNAGNANVGAAGGSGGAGSGSGGSVNPQSPGGAVGVDIQDFPFASFANALSGRGLSTEGVLGSTLSQGFNRLFPALTVGTRSGVLPAIGEDPGAFQDFFGNNLNSQSRLAGQVLNNLAELRGTTDPAIAQFFDPSLGTTAGEAAFNDLRDLAAAAAGNRYGSFVANRFAPSNTTFRNRFEQLLAGSDGLEANKPDFFRFARQQFGV